MPGPVFRRDGVVLPSMVGELYPPDDAWLAQEVAEEVIDPALPIIDTHHHLWVRPGYRYLLPEFAADLATGHNVVATVFAECSSMYRAGGPEELRPVGETEFVVGQAAQRRIAGCLTCVREQAQQQSECRDDPDDAGCGHAKTLPHFSRGL